MMIVLTPEFIFKFTKYSTAFLCFWPPYKDSSRNEIIKFNIKWWIMLIISIVAFVFATVSMFKKPSDDTLMMMYFLTALVTCVQIPLKMIVSKLQGHKFQLLFGEMENYIRQAPFEERSVFLYYANHYGFIHIGYSILLFLAAVNVIVGPAFLSQSLPCDVEYPFNVDKHPVLGIVYFLQSVQLCQCSSSVAVDCQMAVLIWYLVARFEILGIDVKSIKNAHEFGCWIEKHQNLLHHAGEVVNICKYLNVITVILIIIPTIFAGIIVQLNAPLPLKLQFLSIVCSFIGQLFISCWPSEILMEACENIAWDVYDSDYLKNNFDQRAIFVIHRTQFPPTISIAGIIPAMSLTFYSQFLSKTFSYFTTVRLLISQMDG